MAIITWKKGRCELLNRHQGWREKVEGIRVMPGTWTHNEWVYTFCMFWKKSQLPINAYPKLMRWRIQRRILCLQERRYNSTIRNWDIWGVRNRTSWKAQELCTFEENNKKASLKTWVSRKECSLQAKGMSWAKMQWWKRHSAASCNPEAINWMWAF